MQTIRITLKPEVVKFLNHHLNKKNDVITITQLDSIGKHILQFLKIAPNGYKNPDTYNFEFIIKYNWWQKNKIGLDERYVALFIDEKDLESMNIFYSKFIKNYFCCWCYKQREANPGIEETMLIEDFKKIYNITEEEISSHSLHVAYWRFRQKFKKPEQFLLKLIDKM